MLTDSLCLLSFSLASSPWHSEQEWLSCCVLFQSPQSPALHLCTGGGGDENPGCLQARSSGRTIKNTLSAGSVPHPQKPVSLSCLRNRGRNREKGWRLALKSPPQTTEAKERPLWGQHTPVLEGSFQVREKKCCSLPGKLSYWRADMHCPVLSLPQHLSFMYPWRGVS